MLTVVSVMILSSFVYAADSSTKDRTDTVFKNMKEKNSDKYDKIMDIQTDVPQGEVDAEDWIDDKTKTVLYWWDSFRKGSMKIAIPTIIFFELIGLFNVSFKKDKLRQKRGYWIMFVAPFAFFLIIYGPLILSFFE